MGPQAFQSARKHLLWETQGAKSDGALLLTGGKRPTGFHKGYYVEPTIFTSVKPNMQLWHEEVFGPVLACATFKTEEEAIQIANATKYGLAGAVITQDTERYDRQ